MFGSRSQKNNTKRNKKLSEIYYNKVMNNSQLECIPEILNDEFIFTIPTHPEVFKGINGFEEEVTGLHGAFPDVHLDVHNKWCFDDLIIGLWKGTGTHNGDKPLSTPNGPLYATGNSFEIEGVSWIRADGELLRENLANEDTLKILHDLKVKDCSDLYSNAQSSLVISYQFPSSSSSLLNKNLASNDTVLNHPLLLNSACGREQINSFFTKYWSSFSNVQYNITHSKSDKNINAYRWTFTADHTSNFFSIPPSNKKISHQGVTVCILDSSGSIVSTFINENLIVLLSQIENNKQ